MGLLVVCAAFPGPSGCGINAGRWAARAALFWDPESADSEWSGTRVMISIISTWHMHAAKESLPAHSTSSLTHQACSNSTPYLLARRNLRPRLVTILGALLTHSSPRLIAVALSG